MGFFRPEATEALWRWRETIAGAASLILGGIWMLGPPGALQIIGTVLAVGGALLVGAGIQRARFRRGGAGPGIVEVNEGQLAYFGPAGGGVLAIHDLVRIELDPGGPGRPVWVLSHRGGDPVSIPVDAAGSDLLFDVFAALPGLNTGRLLSRLNRPPRSRVTIWERAPARVAVPPPRLH